MIEIDLTLLEEETEEIITPLMQYSNDLRNGAIGIIIFGTLFPTEVQEQLPGQVNNRVLFVVITGFSLILLSALILISQELFLFTFPIALLFFILLNMSTNPIVSTGLGIFGVSSFNRLILDQKIHLTD